MYPDFAHLTNLFYLFIYLFHFIKCYFINLMIYSFVYLLLFVLSFEFIYLFIYLFISSMETNTKLEHSYSLFFIGPKSIVCISI